MVTSTVECKDGLIKGSGSCPNLGMKKARTGRAYKCERPTRVGLELVRGGQSIAENVAHPTHLPGENDKASPREVA